MYNTSIKQEEGLPTRLGIKAFPEDDFWSFKDHRNDRVWQALLRIARKNGIKVYVRELTGIEKIIVRGKYIKKGSNEIIIINSDVPNWWKPRVLAHEIAHYKLHHDLPVLDEMLSTLDQSDRLVIKLYQQIIEEDADKYGSRLIKHIKWLINKKDKVRPKSQVA
jgi:hypothetical protein